MPTVGLQVSSSHCDKHHLGMKRIPLATLGEKRATQSVVKEPVMTCMSGPCCSWQGHSTRQQQHCEAISMQLAILLALVAMHQSYAAKCLLPHPNEPQGTKLISVHVQTKAASRRVCGI